MLAGLLKLDFLDSYNLGLQARNAGKYDFSLNWKEIDTFIS
jgi:hypothetical protein